MLAEILIRSLLAAGILSMGYFLYRMIELIALQKARKAAQNLPGKTKEETTLVYFTNPACIPCKTSQRPIVEKLKARMGERLKVIEIDTDERPDLARTWGVMSVPTTVILDAQGKPRKINFGVTSLGELTRQLAAW